MKLFNFILCFFCLFPTLLKGEKKVCEIHQYKISKKKVRQFLYKKMSEAFIHYSIKSNRFYYGIVRLEKKDSIGKIFSFQIYDCSDYFLRKPIWGVAYIKSFPIFFVGEVDCCFLKSKKKMKTYDFNFDGVMDPYETRFRIVELVK